MCLEVELPGARVGTLWGHMHKQGQWTSGRPGRALAGGTVRGECGPAGPQQAGLLTGACSQATLSLGWETFLLFVTGINHFHHMGFYEENSSPGWASAFNLLTLASSLVHRGICEIQLGFFLQRNL